MSALLRAELLKLRTTRTFVALVGAALVLSLVITVLFVLLSSSFSKQDVRDLFTRDVSSLFILLLGVMGLAGEWRHRTITSTVLAAPDRLRLLSAKVLAYAVAGALLSLIVTVTTMLVGSLLLSSQGFPTLGIADLADILWRNLLVAALLGALGVCIGGIVRNQVAAIVGLLAVGFVVEPTLFAVAPDVGRFTPLVNAPNAIAGIDAHGGDGTPLTEGAAVLVMLAWLTALFALTAALLRGRDLV